MADNPFKEGFVALTVFNSTGNSQKSRKAAAKSETKSRRKFKIPIPDNVLKKITTKSSYPNCDKEVFFSTNISILEQHIQETKKVEEAYELFNDYEYEDIYIYRNHFMLSFSNYDNPLLSILITCTFPIDYQRKYTIVVVEDVDEETEKNTPFVEWVTNRKTL